MAELTSARVRGGGIAREVSPDRAEGERVEAHIAEVRAALARGHLAHAVRLVEASLAAGAADTAR